MDCVEFSDCLDKEATELNTTTLKAMHKHAINCELSCIMALRIWIKQQVNNRKKRTKFSPKFLNKLIEICTKTEF